MSVKPILFNTDMVRAILDGRKTVTRQMIKTQHKDAYGFNICRDAWGNITGVADYDESDLMAWDYNSPPYQPGDILYVRETWKYYEKRVGSGENCHIQRFIAYKADDGRNTQKCSEWYEGKWHPSIHMPKEAARIWLKVTDVRVERLQDMTDNGCLREGVVVNTGEYGFMNLIKPRMKELWDSTIKKEDLLLYGWQVNPWVWVIEFERCEKPEDEL